ncbi:MAG: DUF1850 domain-containing protein [Desulfobacter sp.]
MRPFGAGVPALVLAACILTMVPARSGSFPHLVVARFPGGDELARLRLAAEPEQESGFSLSFIHSVSKTRVTDVYTARPGGIVQTSERFRAHGAGLPSHPDEPGGLSWEKQGDEFILHMERPIPRLVVRTDQNYENRLILGKTTLNLNQWEDQALLIYIDAD